MIMPMVPTMPTPTRITHAMRGGFGLLSFDSMNRTSHTANTPTA